MAFLIYYHKNLQLYRPLRYYPVSNSQNKLRHAFLFYCKIVLICVFFCNILDPESEKQLRIENEELRRRLVAFERVSQENLNLRRSKEESDILRSCLNSAQEEVSRLLDEKKRLLDEIKKLQDQLLPDRSRQWTAKR